MAKTVIITGASSGIGYQLALLLADKKCNLVLAARNMTALQDLKAICEAKGSNVLIQATDVSEPDQCKDLVKETLQRFKCIDVLINNAGISMFSTLEEVEDISIFEKLIKINYLGTVYCTYHALPSLKQQKGLIVGMSSLQGLVGFPRSSGYSASKFAMQGFLESIRCELADDGVQVLIVSPGPVATGIRNRRLGKTGEIDQQYNNENESNVMLAETCAALIIQAMERRDRELIITFKGKMIKWLKVLAPSFLEKRLKKEIAKFYAKH